MCCHTGWDLGWNCVSPENFSVYFQLIFLSYSDNDKKNTVFGKEKWKV